MKTQSTSLRVVSTLTGAAILSFFPQASAATLTWDANGNTALQTDGAGAWDTATQLRWWDGLTNVDWTSGDSAIFGNGGAGGAVTLASPTNIGSLTFDYFTGTYTLGTAANAITINNGITKNAGSGIVNFASDIILGAAQTWRNNSSTNLTNATGTRTLNNGGFNLTFDGSGSFSMVTGAGNTLAITGSGGIIKNGTGDLLLDSNPTIAHSFTGDIVVNGGSIGFQTASVLSGKNTTLNGGYLGGRFNSGFTWTGGLGTGANQIQIIGGVSGFSGESNSASTFQIGTALSVLKWGATGENGATGFFNPTALFLNGSARMNANGTGPLNNGIDVNGSDRTFTSNHTNWDGVATTGGVINGAIVNTAGTAAGIIRTGIGNLSLIAANTYDGATTIMGGTLTLRTAGTANSTSALNLSGGGILRLVNTAQVNRFADGVAITSNGGGITYENTSGANVYTETIGSFGLVSGQTNLLLTTNQAGAGSQTLTLSGLTRTGATNTSAVTFSALTTGPQASGNKNMFVVTGAGTTTANEIIGSWATIGTTAALQTDYAVYNSDYVTAANIAASAQSTWTTTTSATSNYTMSALASGTLDATRNINSLRSTNGSVTVTASSPDIALASHTLAVGDIVTFSATTMPTGLTAGTPYYVVATGVGTIQVSATSGGGAITPTTTGTTVVAAGGILLSSGNNLGTTGILNGSATTLNILATGTGAVTLPTTTAGNLYVTTGSGGITIGAPITDNTGALTLVKNGSGGNLILNGVNTFTGNLTINAGTLQIGTNGVANGASLNSGNYAGNIFIAAGANLDFQNNVNQTLSGVISGDGNLLKRYAGTLTLSGDNTYTGKTTIASITNGSSATLVVSSINSVFTDVGLGTVHSATSSLGAPITVANGTIDLGSGQSSPNPTFKYIGSGEITDRVINITFNSGASRTIDASATGGTGLLKFTSAFTSNGTTTGSIILQGTTNGEIVQGLAFGFTNLTKSGNGTWTLGGAVGSTGLITVNAGTLALQKKSSIQGGLMSNWTGAKINVKSGATLALNVDSSDTAGISAASLNTLLTNISVAGSAAAGLQSGARIGLDTSTATGGTFTQGNIIANSSGANGGAIGLTKLGTGTLILDKTNTYTGATTVSDGTLLVNGSISSVSSTTVASGATIGGSGTVGALTVSSGGFISGGDSGDNTSIFNINGAYSQAGLYTADIAGMGAGNFDQLNVTGAVDITGGSLTAMFTSGSYTNGDLIFILTNDLSDAIIGTYGSAQGATVVSYGGFDWSISYEADSVGNSFTGGNDIALMAIPEPKAALLGCLGILLLLRRRR